MEPMFRRAASSLCGRCSASLRRQATVGRAGQLSIRAAGTIAPLSTKRTAPSSSTSRTFTTSAESKSEAAVAGKTSPPSGVKLSQDDLFHPFSSSPVPEFRHRAAFMRQHAQCPHPDHKPTKLPTVAAKPDNTEESNGSMPPAHVDFECPDCGVPVYCSKEHWMDHYEEHLKVCDTLRQINEDDHDLRSGRVFNEGNLPDLQLDEAAVNMTNWDTFMYTREFEAVNSDRSMRQITRLLTYPITVGSVLHELSPYSLNKGERLTAEGLKSFSGEPPRKDRLDSTTVTNMA